LVRVRYSALSNEGVFTGRLVIQGDTWETVSVPLSLFLADVATSVTSGLLTIIQGEQADLAIAIHSLAGPAVDVTYEMSRTQLHTGLSLLPNMFHLGAKENKPGRLTFRADPQAPLGSNAVAIDQLAFRRRGFFFQANVVQRPHPPPKGTGGRFCDFAERPGSPTVGPNAYGLKNGFARKSLLTWSIKSAPDTLASAGLNGAASAGLNARPATGAPPTVQSELQTAFNLWSSKSAVSFNRLFPDGSSADIMLGAQNFGGPNPSTGSVTLANTAPDGSSIDFSNNPAAVFVPQAPGANSFLATALHEIGHALGLLHNTNPTSVMFPNITVPPNESLSQEDVAAVQALYNWRPQFPIPGPFGTQAGPALCGCGGTLVLTWRGIGDDHNIRYSVSKDGFNWSDPRLVAGAASDDSPSLAWDGTLLWMAWKGVPGDQGLYFATWNLNPVAPWVVRGPINGVGSNFGPSIAIVGLPRMVWKGVKGDSGIYAASFTGGKWVQQTQNPIPGIGTSDRPAIAADPVTSVPVPNARLVWKGVEGDSALYTTTQRAPPAGPATIGFWQPQEQVAWIIAGDGGVGTVEVGRPGSKFGPGLVTAGGRLEMVWRGVGDDEDLLFTQAAPSASVGGQTIAEWSTQAHVGGFASSRFASASRPAIASFSGRTFLAWRGAGADHRIFISSE
jgi:hypothetical protein